MIKVFIVILLAAGVGLYFPESRAVMAQYARPLLNPVFGWQTKDEMEQIVRDLRTYEHENYDRLPDRRQWPEYLANNYQGGDATDSWGSDYHFMIQRDSFLIISYGPDKIYGTEDDIRTGGIRAAAGR